MPAHTASPHTAMEHPTRPTESGHSSQPTYRVTDMDLSPMHANGNWTQHAHGPATTASTNLPRVIRAPLLQFRPTNGVSHPISELPLDEEDEFGCESPTGLAQSPLSPPTAAALREPIDIYSSHHEPSARRDSLSVHLSSRSAMSLNRKTSSSSLQPMSRTPSLKAGVFSSSIGPASAASSCFPSPVIAAMGDVTPLPSPMMPGASPGPWRRLAPQHATHERSPTITQETVESLASALASVSKRPELPPGNSASQERADGKRHGRNRSVSEYIPDPLGIPKRHVTVSAARKVQKVDGTQGTLEPHIKREANLAKSRGILPALVSDPPSPPRSVSSRSSSENPPMARASSHRREYFEAWGRKDGKRRRWRSVRLLGEGTFSRVMLATSQTTIDDYDAAELNGHANGKSAEWSMRRSLVAVKVCEHGPRGGASEERVEMSLRRELEIMQIIHHPSLVDLKAWSIEPTRALLVLSYCPGGDLFDVATAHRSVLGPSLMRRMFAELVGAVRYLHSESIVHRDVKLENVLVNLPVSELADPSTDWTRYPYSVITLTDLGLSRKVADGERLETRCGSDDYAAPEVIMGQPYDGRATDAWSLGVLLYALLEARLPFDPPPNIPDSHRLRSRASHRIARVDWNWIDYGGDHDTEHEGNETKFSEKGLLGAMEITEGLLKRSRSRWPLEKVAATEWVKGAIAVPGGVKFREEDDGEVVQ